MKDRKKNITDFAMYTASTNYTPSPSDGNLMDAIVYGVETARSKLRKNKLAYVPDRKTLVERFDQMYRQQRKALTNSGYGLTKKQLMKKDTIDLRPLIPEGTIILHPDTLYDYPLRQSKEYMDYLMSMRTLENAFCLAVPPLSDFVFRLNNGRWFHVKLEKIDLPHWKITYQLQDYVMKDGLFRPGVQCIANIRFNEIAEQKKDVLKELRGDVPPLNANIHIEKSTTAQDLNRMVPYQELGWNDTDITMWEAYDEKYAKAAMKKMDEKDTSGAEQLTRLTAMYIALTNYMLHANKPVISRKERPDAKPQTIPKVPKDNNKDDQQTLIPEPPERRVRTVGAIKVTSADIPRRPTMETIRHYKIAVWKARGGIRHMKDGRLIPFKECIKHRKALEGTPFAEQNQLPAQTVLRLKDNRENSSE